MATRLTRAHAVGATLGIVRPSQHGHDAQRLRAAGADAQPLPHRGQAHALQLAGLGVVGLEPGAGQQQQQGEAGSGGEAEGRRQAARGLGAVGLNHWAGGAQGKLGE